MSISITWHGHATFSLNIAGTNVVVDPFFAGNNPAAKTAVADVAADFILQTHGHGDHIADTVGLAKRTGARILLASSSEVYGDAEVHPQQEKYWGNVNPVGLRSCYDEGKRVAETLMMDYYRQNKVDIRIVRIFNTYGPRMAIQDGRVVSNFIVQALKKEDITVYGDGTQTRSFCYVSDLVEGLIRMMEVEDFTGPMNLGNPEEFTILELAEEVLRLTKSPSQIIHKPLPSDDPVRRCPDISKAKQKLNWKPEVHLKEGLQKTIAYFREELGTAQT